MDHDEVMLAVMRVLQQFGISVPWANVRSLGNAGGLSGAAIWQIDSPPQPLCLRRWPEEHPTREHLTWVHGHLQRARQRGCDFLPVPIPDRRGRTVVEDQGRLWELAPWMPGKADFGQRPSDARLIAALTSLARVHEAMSGSSDDRVAVSPGIELRWDQVRAATPAHLERLARAVDNRFGSAVERLARDILKWAPQWLVRATGRLDAARGQPTPLQPCLRDIWHAHVLFDGEHVSGMVDFGAMRVDSPAGDLARLLGSLAASDAARWATGLQAYERVRPLRVAERHLVAAFDSANPPLSGLNWVRWLFLEDRRFERLSVVEGRMADIADRLRVPPTTDLTTLPNEQDPDDFVEAGK